MVLGGSLHWIFHRVLARALADFGGSAAAKIQRLNFNLHM